MFAFSNLVNDFSKVSSVSTYISSASSNKSTDEHIRDLLSGMRSFNLSSWNTRFLIAQDTLHYGTGRKWKVMLIQ